MTEGIAHPACVISTHLDDAALSCGHWLSANPGATVLTVYAGAPDIHRTDGWNFRTTGESSARRAIATRRAEDLAAMARVGASPRWLDFWDSQYPTGRRQRNSRIVSSIALALEEIGPASVLAPIGLHHPDHRTIGDLCLLLAHRHAFEWYFYLDMPYAQTCPHELPERIREVAGDPTVQLHPLAPFEPVGGTKRSAVQLYRSQWGAVSRTLAGFEGSFSDPEQFWRIGISESSAQPVPIRRRLRISTPGGRRRPVL
jgi:LmbE family N-acetylglucosaminyl deacetylase